MPEYSDREWPALGLADAEVDHVRNRDRKKICAELCPDDALYAKEMIQKKQQGNIEDQLAYDRQYKGIPAASDRLGEMHHGEA